MYRWFRWMGIGTIAVMLSACGGGGSSADSYTTPSIQVRDVNKTVVLDANLTQHVLAKSVDENNASLKHIVIDDSLDAVISSDKEVLYIAQSDAFPLGYTGKIVERHVNPDGTVDVVVEDMPIEEVEEIHMPETTYDISQMHFVGIIAPGSDVVAQTNGIQPRKVIVDESFPVHFDGKAIQLKSKAGTTYKLKLSDTASVELSGAISNIVIDNAGQFKIDVFNLSNEGSKKIVDVTFWDTMKLQYDLDFEVKLKGKYKQTVGAFDDEWKDLEKVAFEQFGISLTGLKSSDKQGKRPIAGLIYNGIAASGGLGKPKFNLVQGGGIIIWVYLDINGKLSLDGEVGIASHRHTEINFAKPIDSNSVTMHTVTTPKDGKRFLEAPFLSGNFGLSLTTGLALEADVIVGGLRVLNVGGEVKAEYSQELRTVKRVSYGLDTPESDWSWSDGTVCYDGAVGAGAIASASFLAGAQYQGWLGELDIKAELSYQYPSKKDISDIVVDADGEGHVGTWYLHRFNKGCWNVPSPGNVDDLFVEILRQPISEEAFKPVSDANYKYAYLSARVYDDTKDDIGKVEKNWKTEDIYTNPVNGFKCGLYKNIVTGEYILSYGGTTATDAESLVGKSYDKLVDIMTDVSLLGAFSFGQPSEALNALYMYVSQGYNIRGITGHSLGGGLAQYAGVYSGIKTVTFNTAPLPFHAATSMLDLEGKATFEEGDEGLLSVKFEHEDAITNIMTPYDPVSSLSTAIMAVDASAAEYLLGVRFMLGLDPDQRLDFLITGKEIYIPVENVGGFANFGNHSMDLILKRFDSVTEYQLRADIKAEPGAIVFDNALIAYKENTTVPDVSQLSWEIKHLETGERQSGTGLNAEALQHLSAGTYEVTLSVLLDDGRVVSTKTTIDVPEVAQPDVVIDVLNPEECASSRYCRVKIGVLSDMAGDGVRIDWGDGASGGGTPEIDAGESDYSYWEFDHTYSQSGNYTVTATAVATGETATLTLSAGESVGTVTSRLKKTGQTKSYDQNGNEVERCAVKDDGCYQAGVDPHYTRDDATGIVTDHITGLQWQDDYSDNGGKVKEANWDDAKAYCESLILGGHNDWRLPEAKELENIVDYGRSDPAIDPIFQTIEIYEYWSSTISAGYTSHAWHFSIWGGREYNNKNDIFNVRCVRFLNNIDEQSGGMPSTGEAIDLNTNTSIIDSTIIQTPTFTGSIIDDNPLNLDGSLDASDDDNRFTRSSVGIVVDSATGLQWQDDYSDNGGAIPMLSWVEAINYCENLSLDGGGWRLPNIRELNSIVDFSSIKPAIDSIFQATELKYYWSSTTNVDYLGGALIVSFEAGNDYGTYKTSSACVRCVRSGQ